jgi:DNA modification methylase
MSVQIIIGDAREKLKGMPDRSVHCCVTSPPYFGLRDYGVEGQMGLETTPSEYVDGMVEVFREVRRVLSDDGTLWLNIGDSYAGSWGAQGHRVTESDDPSWHGSQIRNHPKRVRQTGSVKAAGVKPKDLYGIPWMLAFALRADGWWLRQDIIWHKPNPMPESTKDRRTSAHEYIFLLSKSPRYHYDASAVAEAAVSDHASGNGFKRDARLSFQNADGTTRGNAEAWDGVGGTRNKRSVWTVPVKPFMDAHFATFPAALIEPCILAGCPTGGTVLDPFGGAGTTGLVADRLGRSAVLIELNPDYAALAERRIAGDGGMFAQVEAA